MAEQRTIYTAGYNARGWTHETLRAVMGRTGAVLIDIRFSPASQRPEWRGDAIKQAFDPHHIRCPHLGNRNYRGGPIEIRNPKAGVVIVHRSLTNYPAVILLCACANYTHCHRTVAAELCRREITEYDIRIEHIEPPTAQGDMLREGGGNG